MLFRSPGLDGSTDAKSITLTKASSMTVVTFEAGPYTYRGTAFTATAAVTGVGGLNQAVAVVYSGDCTNVTSGGCTASATYAGDPNHNGSSGSKSITITKAILTVTSDNKAMVLNGSLPALTGTLTGVKNNDAITASYSTVADGSSVGVFPIVPALNDPYGRLGNYSVTATNGTLTVQYAQGGTCLASPGHQILQPINADGSSVFKQGSTVPAKFRVCDANGNSVGTAGVVASFKLVKSTASVGAIDEDVVSTTPDTDFRWSATDQQWIFNMGSKSLKASTTYYYDITLKDGTHILFNFGLK